MRNILAVLSFSVLICARTTFAATINVPADQPTIQAGINAAANGDTVLVAPGTYFENIDFMGKAITLKSSGGPKVTIIDGMQKDNVVKITNKETTTTVLEGFTIQNGFGTTYISGAGVSMQFSSYATIVGNIIRNNETCIGGGVYAQGGSPVVKQNMIVDNIADCGNGSGGGIEFDAASAPQIIGNLIAANQSPLGNGAGITVEGLFAPALIQNNVIRGNKAQADGGGIYAFNSDDALVIQNLIVGNVAATGAGAYWTVVANTTGPTMINNTFASNSLSKGCSSCPKEGSAVYLDGFYNLSLLENNLFIATPGQSAVYCATDFQSMSPVTVSNDAFSAGGIGFDNGCASQNGNNGNISVDPLFVSTTNFQLQTGSPVIDVGNNSAPDLPKKDLAGNPRIVDGNGDGTKIIDMGAYEFQ